MKSDTQPAFSSNSKNKASDKYCESGSVELKNLDDSVSLIVNTESKEEPDIIYDSDDEFRSKKLKSKPCRKKILKFKSKKFLQEIEKTNIAIECPTGEKTASDFFKSVFPTVSQVRSDGANVSGTSGALDTNNSTCVDAPIASTNEAYCWIPQKHSDSIEAGVQCETQSIVKGNSQESVKELEFLPSSSSTFSNVSSNGTSKVLSDSLQCQISQGMPLSGSPLCSPAENLALSTESRDSQNPNFPSVISTPSTYSNSPNDQRAKCQDSTMTQESKLNSSECSSVALTEEVSRKLSRDFSSDSNPKSSLPLLSNSRFSFDSENSNGRKLNPIISLVDSKIIFPEQKPPTRRQIQASLSANNNWKEPTEIPFYGDPRDLTKPMETGPLVLKVESNAVAGLKEFKSGLNICGTEDIRAQILRVERKEIKFRYLLAGDKEMTITPLKKPPCRSTIFKLSGSKSESNKNKKMFESKTKLILPLSPGQESCSEDELEISLSLTTSEDVEHEIYLCSDKQKNLKNSCGSSSEGRSSADSSNAQNCSVSKATSFKKRKTFKRQSVREKLKPISEEPKSSNSGSTDDNAEVLKQYKSSSDNSFQIRGVTLDNTYGFENSIENHLNLKLTHTVSWICFSEISIF